MTFKPLTLEERFIHIEGQDTPIKVTIDMREAISSAQAAKERKERADAKKRLVAKQKRKIAAMQSEVKKLRATIAEMQS